VDGRDATQCNLDDFKALLQSESHRSHTLTFFAPDAPVVFEEYAKIERPVFARMEAASLSLKMSEK
jgi:hypothetical protein